MAVSQFTSHFDRISLIEKHLELLFNGELSYKMIYSLLDFSESICDYPLPEHYLPRKFALKRDTIVEIFQAFRKFCIDNMPKPDFIRLINEIRSVEDTQQEIRLLQILKIKLSLYGDETDLEKCIDVLQPDSINDFGIATWLTNNYDNAWNLLHYDLIHKKFPKRRFYHPNEMKLREEKSMELLLDYAQFKETVLYIVNQYAPKARKELYAKVKECEENKWDSYVGSFMSLFYNYKTQEYDLQKIKNKIEDQSLYELFVLDQLANHRIKQLTGKQKNCLKVILEHVLPKIKDNRTGQRYLSLALDYEITLDKDVQEICLKYASVRDSRWEHAYSHKPFIDYAVQDLSFTMDSSFWTSSIIDGIKGMVGTSSVNLEKVIKVLSSKITDERTWLNKTIDSIKYSYYEAVDSHMTIELAAEKVRKMKMLSNSLNI